MSRFSYCYLEHLKLYFIEVYDYDKGKGLSEDKQIAKELNLTFSQYKKILNKFNPHINIHNQIFFRTEEDVKKAIETLEVANKLMQR